LSLLEDELKLSLYSWPRLECKEHCQSACGAVSTGTDTHQSWWQNWDIPDFEKEFKS